jgi:hypothetical protein
VLDDGRVAVPQFHPERGFSIAIRRRRLEGDSLAATADGVTVQGGIRGVTDGLRRMRRIRAEVSGGGARADAALRHVSPDRYRFTLDLPGAAGGVRDAPDAWGLVVFDSTGATHRIEWPQISDTDLAAGPHGLRWTRSPTGLTEVARAAARVTSVDLHAERLRVRLEPAGLHLDRCEWTLESADVRVPAERVEAGGEGLDLTFPLTGAGESGELALRSGEWSIAAFEDGRRLPVWVDERVVPGLPIELLGPTHRLRWGLSGARTLSIRLGAPLADDEATSRGQERLRQAYRDSEAPPEPIALVVVAGSRPSPILVDLARELIRTTPDTDVVWAVPDFAADFPRMERATVIGSRDWYDCLASARAVAADGDLEPFVQRRDFQRFLRILPSEADATVGRDAWWAEGFTPGQIDREIARGRRLWDAVVIPDGASVGWYRDQIGFPGLILDHATPMPAIAEAWLSGDVR